MKDLSWKAFCKTGDIDAYLLYNEVLKTEKQRENLCSAVRQEDLSQDAPITENQTL